MQNENSYIPMDTEVNSKTLRIVHQNVQGIVAKLNMVEIFTELVSPSILCLSEHFLSEHELNSFCIPGYTTAAGYCRSSMDKGGVCILINDNLSYEVVNVEEFCTEGFCEFAAITFCLENVSYFLLAVYRPPHKTVEAIDQFLKSLSNCLEDFAKPNVRFIIAGDFNIDMSVCDNSSKKLSETMLSFGLHDTVYSYTREFNGCKSLIDNVFCNVSPQVLNTEVVVSCISDHHAQVSDIKLASPLYSKVPKFRFKRLFSCDNTRIFKSLLKNENWDQVLTSVGINDKMECFNHVVNYYFEVSFPFKKLKIRPRKYFAKIKLDRSLLQMRRDLLDLFFSTKDLETSHPLKVEYLNLKRQYRAAVRTAKTANVLVHLNTSSCKSKAVWDIVNETIPNKCSRPFKSLKIESDCGKILYKPVDIANAFNTFFTNISTTVSDPVALNHSAKTLLSSSSLFLYPSSEDEVLQVIRSLKTSDSAGMDCISSKLLKEVSESLAKPLSHLVNTSFSEGEFPKSLKSAVVKPLYKKGSVLDKNNYRPISITSTLSKVFEKLFLNRLNKFLMDYQVLFDKQFGFQKGVSTVDAMFSFISNVSKALDEHKHVFGIFLDLSKAFDMVNHGLLLKKLEHLGIRGKSLSWISSFLIGRTQVVEIPYLDAEGCISFQKSRETLVTRGVPQGSVLGPILFLLFVNDIHTSVSNVDLCLFADDTSFCLSNTSRIHLEIESFIQSSSLLQWLGDNNLSVNTDKTNFIDFNLRNSTENPIACSIFIGESEIFSCQQTNFLGLIVDSRLNFSEHIAKVTRKLNSSIFILRRLSKFADINVLLTAYFGCFYPHISYGITIWGAESVKTKAVFHLQKRAIRLIFGMNKNDSCRGIFSANNILTFFCLYIYECLSFFIKNKHLFKFRNTSHYNLRHNITLTIPQHNTTCFEKQTYYSVIKLFNVLPPEIKSESNVDRFRAGLKSFLISKEYYSVQEYLSDKSHV